MLALAQLMSGIGGLSEHDLIYPDHLPVLIIRCLQSLLHSFEQRVVATITSLDWHLGDVDNLLLNEVLLVYLT